VTGPTRATRDVVIVGGGMLGAAVAWFLADAAAFDGRVLVVERDPTYSQAATSFTNSCIRQQFSEPVNVRISQYCAEYIHSFRERLGGDPDIPEIFLHAFGYMYLAADDASAAVLRRNQAMQASLGAGTRILSPDEIVAAYPFYEVGDIVCGSHNLVDEGYWDSGTVFDWWRRMARRRGVEFVHDEVVGIDRAGDRVTGVRLASGGDVACAYVVNTAGTRAAAVAAMAGLALPVEARKRYTFVFETPEPLDRDLPLTIDPSGVHVRTDGAAYMAGCTPELDPAVAPDDFGFDHDIFERKVWPVLAHRIPAFERLRITSQWVGHYAYNTLDQNIVVGPHPEVTNFLFANGCSGHGLQQSPAIGRGLAEWITHGEFRSLDLAPLGYARIVEDRPLVEANVI